MFHFPTSSLILLYYFDKHRFSIEMLGDVNNSVAIMSAIQANKKSFFSVERG